MYVQMAALCKRPPPLLACEFQAPMGAYSGQYNPGLIMYDKGKSLDWYVD